jgi:pimeloyl-ACP methyl ester carboxylesterase
VATVSAAPAAQDAGEYGSPPHSAWIDIDWSRYQRWLTVDGRPVNVIEIGEGPPLLFVHGHAGCWQNWLENIPYFAQNRRVIVPDLPGFGWSPMPAGEVSITNYAGILDSICDQLEIDGAAVVGNSMGGFIAAEMAIRFPQRVERLGLIAAAGLSRHYMRIPISVMANPRGGGKVLFRLFAAPYDRARKLSRRRRLRKLSLWAVVRHPERISPPMAAYLIAGSGKPGAAPASIALATYDFRDRVGEIACPTLVLWGEDDFVIAAGAADRYERLIPNSRKVVLADTGHVPMVERPAQFNAILEEFLAE